MSPIQTGAALAAAETSWAQYLDELPEEGLVELRIKLFGLPPKLDKHLICWATGITITDYYDLQDPKKPVFDKDFPPPHDGRRSDRSPRLHCAIKVLLWDIRRKKMIDR